MYQSNKQKTYRNTDALQTGTIRGREKNQLATLSHTSLESLPPEQAVLCPYGVDENDWISIHVYEFYKDLNWVYAVIMDDCTTEKCPTMSAGKAYEYLWADREHNIKPTHLSAHEYVDKLFDWVERQMYDTTLFPVSDQDTYPPDFLKKVQGIFKRLFRVYGHVYYNHFTLIELAHFTNTFINCFRHFVYFVSAYHLIDSMDLKPCYTLIMRQCPNSVAFKELAKEEQIPGTVTDMSVAYPNAGPCANSIPYPPESLRHDAPIVPSPYKIEHQLQQLPPIQVVPQPVPFISQAQVIAVKPSQLPSPTFNVSSQGQSSLYTEAVAEEKEVPNPAVDLPIIDSIVTNEENTHSSIIQAPISPYPDVTLPSTIPSNVTPEGPKNLEDIVDSVVQDKPLEPIIPLHPVPAEVEMIDISNTAVQAHLEEKQSNLYKQEKAASSKKQDQGQDLPSHKSCCCSIM
ncbi:hypothetical protein WA158_006541 [Blastocystis sp. Blastoise]